MAPDPLRAVLTTEEAAQRAAARRLRDELGRSLEAVERALHRRADRTLAPVISDLLHAADAARRLALEIDPGPGADAHAAEGARPGDVSLLPALRRYALGVAARSGAALRLPPGDGPPVPRGVAVQLYRIFQHTARAVAQAGPGTALKAWLRRGRTPWGRGGDWECVELRLEVTPEELPAPGQPAAPSPVDGVALPMTLLAARCAVAGATLDREPLGDGGLRLVVRVEFGAESGHRAPG